MLPKEQPLCSIHSFHVFHHNTNNQNQHHQPPLRTHRGARRPAKILAAFVGGQPPPLQLHLLFLSTTSIRRCRHWAVSRLLEVELSHRHHYNGFDSGGRSVPVVDGGHAACGRRTASLDADWNSDDHDDHESQSEAQRVAAYGAIGAATAAALQHASFVIRR